jgi:hypothetical protein
LEESYSHLARSTIAGLTEATEHDVTEGTEHDVTEATEHDVTAVVSLRLKAVMATAVELNAFIFKEANCVINIMVWGMRTEFQ